MKQKDISNKINNRKNENIELIIITVIVGLGVNVLATALINLLPTQNNIYYLLLIGIILSLFVLFIYIFIKVKSLKSEVEIKSNFIFNSDIKDIVIVPDYQLTIDMKNYLLALFLDNNKIKDKFFKSDYIKTNERNKQNREDDDFKNIINELIEYLILNKLSLSFIDFYSVSDKVFEYNIDNIPKEIKENIFLKTFSKDVSKRKEFKRKDILQACINKVLEDGKEILVSSHTADGYIYEKFELYLPKKTKIYKNYKNQIIIDNKFYKITIEWLFDYYGGNFESEFFENIIGRKRDWEKDDDFCFDISIDIKFKPFFIFNKNKQKHYDVLDLVIDNFIDYFDYKNHLEKINWNLVKTICKYNKREL